jgi:hypothetical protein
MTREEKLMWVIENLRGDQISMMYLTGGGSMYINAEYDIKLHDRLVNLLGEPSVELDQILFEKNGITVILILR